MAKAFIFHNDKLSGRVRSQTHSVVWLSVLPLDFFQENKTPPQWSVSTGKLNTPSPELMLCLPLARPWAHKPWEGKKQSTDAQSNRWAAAEKPPPVPEVLFKLPIFVEEGQPDAGLESTWSSRNSSAEPDSPGVPGTDKPKTQEQRLQDAGCSETKRETHLRIKLQHLSQGSPLGECPPAVRRTHDWSPGLKFLNEWLSSGCSSDMLLLHIHSMKKTTCELNALGQCYNNTETTHAP